MSRQLNVKVVIHAPQEIYETPNKGNRQKQVYAKALGPNDSINLPSDCNMDTVSLLLLSKDQKTLTLANSF
jgi:hypothetical protein